MNGSTSRMEYHNDFFNCKNVDQKKIEAGVDEEAKKLNRWKQISDLCAAPCCLSSCVECTECVTTQHMAMSAAMRRS